MQRVAWPNPQFNGATNTAFGYYFGVKNEKVIACKSLQFNNNNRQ